MDKAVGQVFFSCHKGSLHKGNLHAHTTLSDGNLSPSEVVGMYKDRGYSFLAFTDHRLFTHHESLEDPGFLVIPGIERDLTYGDPKRYLHVNGLLGPSSVRQAATRPIYRHMEHVPRPEGTLRPQILLDELTESGCLAVVNHPQWSFSECSDLVDLSGYFAVEIYNNSSEVESRTGVSTIHWDALLRRGRKVWGVACDDNHNGNKYGEAPPSWDSFGGWVTVCSRELTHEAIMESLLAGNFYSSTGPEIHYLGMEDGLVQIRCSPVRRIHFITYWKHGYCRCNPDGGPIESAEYQLRGDEDYVRVECVDEFGRTAWSNPIFLRD